MLNQNTEKAYTYDSRRNYENIEKEYKLNNWLEMVERLNAETYHDIIAIGLNFGYLVEATHKENSVKDIDYLTGRISKLQKLFDLAIPRMIAQARINGINI